MKNKIKTLIKSIKSFTDFNSFLSRCNYTLAKPTVFPFSGFRFPVFLSSMLLTFLVFLFPVAAELCGDKSSNVFAQEANTNQKAITDTTQHSVTIPNAPQTIGDSVTIKSGSKVLMTVTEETTAGSIKLKDAGAVSSSTDKLYNKQGDLYWGNNQVNTSSAVDKDWTITGNNIYSANSGNVGIGTTNPTSELSVGGDGVFDATIYGLATDPTHSAVRGYASYSGPAGSINFGGYFEAASTSGRGVYGTASGTFASGVYAVATGSLGVGIFATSPYLAGKFDGDVEINGNVEINGTLGQEYWTAPSLLNSWTNYNAGFNPTAYFKDSNGIVHLRGMIKSGASGTVIFTLPNGYRPQYHEVHSTISFGTNAARWDILANGDVKMIVGSSSYFSLDGITFRAN
ncbi:MAG: hypothetical protein V3V16_06585 [Melioribacteraceae bacterium]